MEKQPQNIAILGAGIMGLSASYALTRAGHSLTLYDPQGFPAHNASWMAGGMLAPYSEIEHMDTRWVKAGLEGIELWQSQFPELVACNGSLLIAHNDDRYILERFKSHLPGALQNMQRPQDIEAQIPDKFQNGLLLEEEAHLDPHTVINTLIDSLKQSEACSFHKTHLPSKDEVQYDHIIDCRGMASNDPELRGVKGEIAIVRNPEFTLSRPVRIMHPRYPLYIVPRANGVFMIGATVIESEDEQVTMRSGLELLSALYALHPSFGEAEILSLHAGVRPSYPDNLPRITISDRLISCNGLFRHGYLLAPVMAACVADYIAGDTHKFWSLFTKLTEGDAHDRHDQRRTQTIRSAA